MSGARKMKLKELPLLKLFFHWLESADSAAEGIIHATKTQRHVRIHLTVAFFVLFGCFLIGVDKFEFIAIALITLLVIMAEMFNSSLEVVVDLKSPEKNELARIAKDIAAGAVLICAVGALIIGYLILWPYFLRIIHEGFWIAKHYPENIAVLALIIIMLVVIMMKALLGKGHPFRGGCPSGYAAVLFSLWISISYISDQVLVVTISLILVVALSLVRVFRKNHSPIDISIGALLGTGITFLLFQIFY
jgi:diacylglycerol kinase (ATP)